MWVHKNKCNNQVVSYYFLVDQLLSDFVIFTDPYHKQIYQMGLYTDTPEGILLPDIEFPVSMDIDSKGTVYWIDRKAGVIQSSPMLGKSQLGESAKLLRQIPQGQHEKEAITSLRYHWSANGLHCLSDLTQSTILSEKSEAHSLLECSLQTWVL